MADLLAGSVQRGEAGEVVALLSRDGETQVETAGGADPDTIFRIASMSKPVVAVAALVLVEECVLRLDDPVDEFLPELASRRVLTRVDAPLDDTVPAERPITLRDLLTFQLGLGFGQGMWGPPGSVPIMDALDALRGGMPQPAAVVEPDEWMRQLGALPLVAQPGTRWLYNTGSDILGVLIARVTGQPLGDFLQERIFQPLGMTDTGFWVPPDSISRLPTQYTRDACGELVVYDPPDGQWAAPPAFPSGAGGLVSTAPDYLAFASMLMGGGIHRGVRILSRPSVSLMTSDQLPAVGEGRLRPRAGRLRRHGLGVRRVGGDAPDAGLPLGRDLRLERRAGHHLGQRPGREPDADPAHPARVHLAPGSGPPRRLLDHGLSGP